MIRHYFSGTDPGRLTLDQLWDHLKFVKRLLGQDDEETAKPDLAQMSPDEAFQKMLSGEIDVEELAGGDVMRFERPAQTQEAMIRGLGPASTPEGLLAMLRAR